MSDFDVITGISENELNRFIKLIIDLRPNLFSVSGKIEKFSIEINYSWNLLQLPTFDLSYSGTNKLKLNLPEISITMSYKSRNAGDKEVKIKLSFSFECEIGSDDKKNIVLKPGNVIFEPYKGDEIEQYLVNKIVLPEIEKVSHEMVAKIKIPSIDLYEIGLSYPHIEIRDRHIVITSLLVEKGPSAPSKTPVPNKDFYVLLSQDPLQKIVSNKDNPYLKDPIYRNYDLKEYINSGEGRFELTTYLSDPQIKIKENGFDITFNSTSKVFIFLIVKINYLLGSYTVGIPPIQFMVPDTLISAYTTVSRITPDNNLFFKVNTVNSFDLKLVLYNREPNNHWWDFLGLVDKAIDSILSAIEGTINSIISSMVKNYVQGLEFGGIKIKGVEIEQLGEKFTIEANNLSIENFNNHISVLGSLNIK